MTPLCGVVYMQNIHAEQKVNKGNGERKVEMERKGEKRKREERERKRKEERERDRKIGEQADRERKSNDSYNKKYNEILQSLSYDIFTPVDMAITLLSSTAS